MRGRHLTILSSLHRLFRAETGMAAVEFALILPILVTLWIGGVEVTQGLSVDRRLNNLASAIGDLVSRDKELKYSSIDSIFDIDVGALYPFSTTGLSMRVTAVNIDEDEEAKVIWSRARGTQTARAKDAVLTNLIVPDDLRTPETQIIMAEVFYTYSPAVGYVITGDIELDDRVYFTPRKVNYIKLCDNNGANCAGPPA